MSPEPMLELQAIEAALAGDRSDPELTVVIDEARASAPRMTPAFAARLDEAVAEGFPRASARARSWWRPGPALGLAGAAALAVGIGIAVIPGGGGSHPETLVAPSGGAAATAKQGLLAPTTGAAAPATREVAPGDEAAIAPHAGLQRVQEHAAQLTLTTPASKLQDTADQVMTVTDRMGGYVQSSNVAARSGGGEASFDLRIPASRLDEAMAALSRLGHVKARSEQAQDITASYTSARARLHDAQAERQGLLRALAAATTTSQIESIKARLRIVRAQISSASAELASVRHRANYARVAVTVMGTAQSGAATHHGGSPWTPGRALHDAGRVLSVAAGVAIVALSAAIPLALLAGLAWLGVRATRRRRREAALDGTAPAV